MTQPTHTPVTDHQQSPAAPAPAAAVLQGRWKRWLGFFCVFVVLVIGGSVGGALAIEELGLNHRPMQPRARHVSKTEMLDNTDDEEESAPIPVNTVTPKRKTLAQVFPDQPASIEPFAQAELFAKASGTIKWIGRDLRSTVAQGLAGQLAAAASPAGSIWNRIGPAAAGIAATLHRAPRIDYGSFVREGDILLVIDAPELVQRVAMKETLWRVAEADLEATRTALDTYDALVEAARANKRHAEAEVIAAAGERDYRNLDYGYHQNLFEQKTIQKSFLDEKQKAAQAGISAYEASLAKVLAAEADIKVAQTKLITARADLRVKEAHVRAAREDHREAQVLADFAYLRAPFDGVITYRGVDEGDFVQNSSTRENKQVMTVTAVDPLRVVLNVPERDAAWVRVGAPATVQVDALDRWQVTCPVSRTSRSLDLKTRTLHVEIDLDNPSRNLMPGMYGHVTMTLRKLENVLAIPADAVVSRGSKNYVLIVKDGVAHREQVRIQFDNGHDVTAVKLIDDREVQFDGTEEIILSNKGEIGEGQHVKPTRMPAK